jgi:hypothetical protein
VARARGAAEAGQVCEISPEQFQVKGSRQAARSIVALLARQHNGATLRELSQVLGLQRSDRVPTLLKKAQHAPANSHFARLAWQNPATPGPGLTSSRPAPSLTGRKGRRARIVITAPAGASFLDVRPQQ